MTPAGTSNELDVQNEWEENTHTNTHKHYTTTVAVSREECDGITAFRCLSRCEWPRTSPSPSPLPLPSIDSTRIFDVGPPLSVRLRPSPSLGHNESRANISIPESSEGHPHCYYPNNNLHRIVTVRLGALTFRSRYSTAVWWQLACLGLTADLQLYYFLPGYYC